MTLNAIKHRPVRGKFNDDFSKKYASVVKKNEKNSVLKNVGKYGTVLVLMMALVVAAGIVINRGRICLSK